MPAPWNLYHSPVFMSPGTHNIHSGHNLYHQPNGIPPGIYIFLKRFSQKLHRRSVGGAFFVAIFKDDTWW